MNLLRRIKALDLVVAFFAVLLVGASSIAHAGPLDNYGENKALDALIRGQAIGTPANWFLRLDTAVCTEGGAGTEVSTTSTGYSRQSVAASLAAWAGTQGAGTTVASSGTGGGTSNNATVSFGPSTAAWGTVYSISFMDAASGGNRWICIDLGASIPVTASGYTITFTAGQIQFQIDN